MARVTVGKEGDLDPGEGRIVEAAGKEIALFYAEGAYYALENTCCHRGGPLGDGELDGTVVGCPWHGWRFDLKTGQCVDPEGEGVACYAVGVEGGEIQVELPD